MTVETKSLEAIPEAAGKSKSSSALNRVLKYSVVRLMILFATVVISIWLTIMIANMGGYVDQIMRGQIRENIGLQMTTDPNLRDLPQEARQEHFAALVAQEERRLGLDQPGK